MIRFTIRDVLWLTVVVALGVGWWIDHRGAPTHRNRHFVRWKFAEADKMALNAQIEELRRELAAGRPVTLNRP